MEKEFYCFQEIEKLRRNLLANKEEIFFEEIGAGSKVFDSTIDKRRVCDIAKTSLSSRNECKTIFNIVKTLKPKKILELGTSLGLATTYMACARPSATILTIEGNKSVLDIAYQFWGEMHLQNVTALNGRFEELLPAIIDNHRDLDMVYIDGNHTYEATINYFNIVAPLMEINKGCIIFDDIHWTKEMYRAWQELIQDSKVTLSIELFDLGIVFFDPIAPKQHFTLIDYWKKPWQIGLF
jgi:predicted O-methyltransferase YrrM